MTTNLTINGQPTKSTSPAGTPLLWVLRDELNLTGTKFGCGIAACGACTVHINGQQFRSCIVAIESLEGADVTTIEGVQDRVAIAVKQAWQALDVVQCGYCQSGQIMSAIHLLRANPYPTDEDIDAVMSGNACRCATYGRIRAAIQRAAELLEAG